MSDQATETGNQDQNAPQDSSRENDNQGEVQPDASTRGNEEHDQGADASGRREDDPSIDAQRGDNQTDSNRQNGSSRGISAGEAIRSAREVIAELTGKQPEGISAINRSGEGGWTIALDVLELSRIPASTDLLATYEVSLDGDGTLVDMERTRRYTRNQVDED